MKIDKALNNFEYVLSILKTIYNLIPLLLAAYVFYMIWTKIYIYDPLQ